VFLKLVNELDVDFAGHTVEVERRGRDRPLVN
jgi:hypothetical protein